MAGRRENHSALTALRCKTCGVGVVGITDAIELVHMENGHHDFVKPPVPRPDHRTVSIWNDVRAVLDNIRMVEFYLGYLPEKPRTGWVQNDDVVRMQLADARAVLGALANALADGADS